MDPSTSSTPTVANEHGVDIQEAIDAFNTLERQLSRTSTLKRTSDDPEKGVQEESAFNLREYLNSVNAANDDAGIHSYHKRVGVSWDDLEVIVPGGIGHKV